MKIHIRINTGEKITNIGIAKALTEIESLSVYDLIEINQYLSVYITAATTTRPSYGECECARKEDEGK